MELIQAWKEHHMDCRLMHKVELIGSKLGLKFYGQPSPVARGGEALKMIGGGGTSIADPSMKGNHEVAYSMHMVNHGYAREEHGQSNI